MSEEPVKKSRKGIGGAPSKYRPEYCERVIEMGREGMSVVEMAAEIGVHRETLESAWVDAHEEFAAAFAHARELSQAWWERQGRLGLMAERFNAQLYSRSMAARFPKDWRETKEQRIAGADGGAVKTEAVGAAPDAMRELTEALLKQAKDRAKK